MTTRLRGCVFQSSHVMLGKTSVPVQRPSNVFTAILYLSFILCCRREPMSVDIINSKYIITDSTVSLLEYDSRSPGQEIHGPTRLVPPSQNRPTGYLEAAEYSSYSHVLFHHNIIASFMPGCPKWPPSFNFSDGSVMPVSLLHHSRYMSCTSFSTWITLILFCEGYTYHEVRRKANISVALLLPLVHVQTFSSAAYPPRPSIPDMPIPYEERRSSKPI